ncbi:Protein MENT, partial [Galemys pyrenaicus]
IPGARIPRDVGARRRARHVPGPPRSVLTTRRLRRAARAAGARASLGRARSAGPMVPAACALLCALLLSLGSRAAGAHTHGATRSPQITGRSPGPSRSYRTAGRTVFSPRTGVSQRSKIRMEDEDDMGAAADRLAGPAAAELLASTVTGVSRSQTGEEDETLEEGVVINASKEKDEGPTTTPGGPNSRFPANIQEADIRLTSNLQPSSAKGGPDSTAHTQSTEATPTTLTQWTTAGSAPSRWGSPSSTAMPAPEDLHLVLMPWGPWHCHCKAGTMSRTRAGKLQGLAGRLRVGALSQLRTEHRPCTYRQCPCNRHREECPLDNGLCADASCTEATSRTTPSTTSTTTEPPLEAKLRPNPLPFEHHPALDFWRQVRIQLEDIWNSLSSVFTEMQPEAMRDPVSSQYSSFLFWRMPIPELDLSELEGLGLSDTATYKIKESNDGKMTRQAAGVEKNPDGDALLEYSTFNFWRAPIASIHSFELDLL